MAADMPSHRGRRGPSSRSGAINEDLFLCDDEKTPKTKSNLLYTVGFIVLDLRSKKGNGEQKYV